MNLTIDIGNTLIKTAVFDKEQILETYKTDIADTGFVDQIFIDYPTIENAIISSTGRTPEELKDNIKGRVKKFIDFNSDVKVPLVNLYQTPDTLGTDRLAAAVAANALYPGSNVLVVDFGTAITFDMVSSRGEFLGGNISPGANLRFRALNQFTSHLPLLSLSEDNEVIGSSSRSAIESGVANGIVYEIEGYVSRLSQNYDDLKIIFTGGDANFFVKRLKNTIFATYDLVAYGLNRILEYNAD